MTNKIHAPYWQDDKLWFPVDEFTPKKSPILAICIHEADTYIKYPSKNQLTLYAAHCEGLGNVSNGLHVVEWGGGFQDETTKIDDWWFRSGSDFEEVANPVLWRPIPGLANISNGFTFTNCFTFNGIESTPDVSHTEFKLLYDLTETMFRALNALMRDTKFDANDPTSVVDFEEKSSKTFLDAERAINWYKKLMPS